MDTFIVSECGINANGIYSFATKQIYESKQAGADAVKFQLYNTYELFKPDFPFFNDSLRGMFNDVEHRRLQNYANLENIEYFASPFHLWAVDVLESMGVKRYKVASRSVTDLELIKKIGETKKPVIISNGLVSDRQLETAILKLGHRNVTILYCVAKYPSTPSDFDLSSISRLKKRFGFPVGLSSHCPDVDFLSQTVLDLKLPMLEVHTTLNRGMPGCDQSSSLEYSELKELVERIRNGQKSRNEIAVSSKT